MADDREAPDFFEHDVVFGWEMLSPGPLRVDLSRRGVLPASLPSGPGRLGPCFAFDSLMRPLLSVCPGLPAAPGLPSGPAGPVAPGAPGFRVAISFSAFGLICFFEVIR